MRESRRSERMHLPRGSTEVWLESQAPSPGEAKHRNPPEDSYEVWVEKRAEKNRGARKTTLKR